MEYIYDTYSDIWKPANGLEYSKMFFRWCISFDRTEWCGWRRLLVA